mmetsp:Transcript_10960/g.44147  ORF Transcript_10960/g.44147 Transcript_10960/m.44147 type:complete len:340 (-) Transcript_10960:152-1171(-)
MSTITIALGGTVAASTAGAARSTSGRSVAKKSAVQVSTRNATVCRVIQDVTSSMDVGSSIDTDVEMRRRMVQIDTAKTLRKTIDAMGGTMIQDPAAFVSTDFQRAVTTGLFASCAALVARGGVGIEMAGDGGDPAAWASLVGSGLLAYWISDLGTGVFHWSVDNYGSKATPVMGGIIDAFQGHHKYPWTITKRQFANNIHTTCPATMCVTVPLLLTPGLAPDTCAFMGVFCSMIVLSQQFHAWSHMKKSQLPEIVVKLQDLGVLISRKGHGAHHRPPFEGNYCIVSGWWNPILDDNKLFNKMEKVIFEATGVAPRCWSETRDFDVEEEAPEGWGKEYNL